ncbi:HAMP domain-containing sensor histidine kinase [Microlunatus sp. Gsoil 973]|uniref:sensor histidine kinase n=1 Tax=Microlunatus sp. Gsoil 973 TaxID=2672569 RepID=UPI0012B4BA22|nr:HAMP domain-containing sensor histidine kinase [Microlunatus sp. Gsoil 973]QGN34955.1 HAMP domain-containing protein [Microlunatus sp. Gsoil 973]
MRRRLALLVAATTSLVLIAFLVPLALLIKTVAADRAVNAATLQAQSLVSIVATSPRSTVSLTVDQVNASGSARVTVFFDDGRQLGRPMTRSAAVELAMRGRSLSVEEPGGRQVLVYVQTVAGAPAVIATFVDDAELRQGVGRAWLMLGLLGVLLMAAGIVVADRLARSMVRPITEVSAVSLRLARGDLDARASRSGPPEIQDVAAALNHLAGRIRDLMREEREAAADLSHRLRTPLTVLRLDTEALPDGEDSERIRADVDNLERAVSQLIADSRRPTGNGAIESDAAQVVHDRLDFWSALAEDTGREVRAEIDSGPVPVAVAADTLAAAVDALLGNVFAHTPDGTAFAVTLHAGADGGVRLMVFDDGPGFGQGAGSAITRGASGRGSTGLGLDIARRAARAGGGDLAVESAPDGGARVTLTFATRELVADAEQPQT